MLVLLCLKKNWGSEIQMAEFIRKKRFFRYHDDQCKKFLSRDFSKRCAYCKIREGDLAGPENFEKDHFLPVTRGGEDKYDNLYYSCKSCNGGSGKWEYWSATLLDPCKDDIWGVHIMVTDKFKCKDLTPQGDEYIKTFKLNRKSYVNKRKTIANRQKELQDKIMEYRKLCQELIESGVAVGSRQFLMDDIQECEKVIKFGANYRLSENCFDEDIDELICSALSKVGSVECVDRDYDLFYELNMQDNKYLCYVEIAEVAFGADGRAKKFISTEKLGVWEGINKKEKILIIIFNKNDQNVYFVKLDEILELEGAKNVEKCAYFLKEENKIDKLKRNHQ